MKTLTNITWGQKNMVLLLRIIFLQVLAFVSTGDNKNRLHIVFTKKRRQKD
jgi:hypothetical protein